ncbi:DUF4394 domain-containing protein [Nocardioides litoris]|uniref:DUF4394 domain-containing protein n=1 Tax=Nocardioides litoris TaxID=1926648 RepID=UPI0011248CAF|nr:DUF4394 domain-containing protein [Nocardioides litoris]
MQHHTRPTLRARRTVAAALAGVLAAGTTAIALAPGAEAANPKAAFGLTAAGKLVYFNTDRPGQVRQIGAVTGLGGQRIIGMDIRPSDGKLYAVGSGGGLFVILKKTARATQVGSLTVGLEGTSFGVDVNPAADALRIVSDTGQNLRHSFAAGTTTEDGDLNVPDTTPQVQGIVGAAYTNNDNAETTGTALYDLNAATDTIALQVPANAGTITNQGPLGIDATAKAGFDIRSTKVDGVTVANTGFATLSTGGRYALYKIDLGSGKATRVNGFRNLLVRDIAVVH